MARMHQSVVFVAAALSVLLLPGRSSASNGGAGRRSLQGADCSKTVTFQGLNYTFENCMTLDSSGDFKLAWTLNETSEDLNFCFEGTPQEPYGWVAWGLSPSGGMKGSMVVLGYGDPGNASIAVVNAYDLNGYSSDSVIPENSINADLDTLALDIINNGNNILIEGTIVNFTGTSPNVIWMGGPAVTSGELQPHANRQPSLQVDFTSSTAPTENSPATSNESTKTTHAWLAGLGFGVFLPLGVVVARYLKAWVDPGWFYAHVGIQLFGYLLGVIGWGYGIYLKGQMGDLSNSPSYTQSHYAIGITIFCTATLQLFTPLVKPNVEDKSRLLWNIAHWGLGYLTIILSITNVFLGFENLEWSGMAYQSAQAVYITYIVLLGVAALVLEVLAWKRYFDNGGSSGITLKPMRLQDAVRQDESFNPYPPSV